MGDKSGIEWTDATWNPVTGCSHVSDGCTHCYAETLTRRLHTQFKAPDLPWTHGNAAVNVILHPNRLDQPHRWRRPRVIFVNSMSDLFHELVPTEYIARIFAVMAIANRHTYQVLTKRPERMAEILGSQEFREMLDAGVGPWPLPNVWLGTSIESARHVDRADYLRQTPAAHRFISAEPLLGPLWTQVDCQTCRTGPDAIGCPGSVEPWGPYRGSGGASCPDCQDGHRPQELDLTGIDWLIAGGESGDHYHDKPGRFLVDAPHHGQPTMDALAWVREIRDKCQETDTRFMLKQWGGRTPKAGGRSLDGRTHDWTPKHTVTA